MASYRRVTLEVTFLIKDQEEDLTPDTVQEFVEQSSYSSASGVIIYDWNTSTTELTPEDMLKQLKSCGAGHYAEAFELESEEE